ncbi:MAG TPA: PfkB family carbohydrate kinase [Candidatus Acidoferrales bacterium]|nr:PfkB family carbohydrate kinase [Candidatus Acidoferrales bacterium]
MKTRKPTKAAAAGPDLSRLLDLIALFPQQTITVVGDFVVDEYVTGEISRVSREAPVIILRHEETRVVPGGGANAVNNLIALGARVLPVGAVGNDAAGDVLVAYFRSKGVNISGIVSAKNWTTTTKTRFLARWSHTARQQVLRVDREASEAPGEGVQRQIQRKAEACAAKSNGTIVSDYGAGVVTPELVKRLRAKVLTLDSRYRLLEYRSANITAATPNEPELEAAYHARVGKNEAQLEALGERTLRALGLQALLVTRGRDGMVLFERGKGPHRIAVYGSDDAVDVTGAGDTVIAVFTLALAAGGSFLEAAHLANFAGGIVVMKRGTATLSRAELEGAVRSEASASS